MGIYYFLSPRCTRSIRYGQAPRNRLDLHRPPSNKKSPPEGYPVVIYLTGRVFTSPVGSRDLGSFTSPVGFLPHRLALGLPGFLERTCAHTHCQPHFLNPEPVSMPPHQLCCLVRCRRRGILQCFVSMRTFLPGSLTA